MVFLESNGVASLDLQRVGLKSRGFGPVNLSFQSGEIALLCGLSGSGKSTLCELLSGIQEPSSGSIAIGGLQVGYVSHDFENQLIGSSVKEELELGSRVGAGSRIDLNQVLEFLTGPLENCHDCDPQNLPSSTQQYLLLATLVKSGVSFLLLDESLSHLDPPGRSVFILALSALAKAGLAILIVSHQPELLAIADRVLLLERGSVSFDGKPADFEEQFFERAGFRRENENDSFLLPEDLDAEGAPCTVRTFDHSLVLTAGQALVLGGYSGAGSSRALNSLFGIEDWTEWSFSGRTRESCLLRQHVAPSFWRPSCAQELEASRGIYSLLPKALESTVLDSIPAGWLSKAPWHLSHGQLRFFGACCLILQMPEVLFLDHPFKGLDGPLREKLRFSLGKYLQLGGRVVLTTHDPAEVSRFGNRAVWLKDSKLEWQGLTDSQAWRDFVALL